MCLLHVYVQCADPLVRLVTLRALIRSTVIPGLLLIRVSSEMILEMSIRNKFLSTDRALMRLLSKMDSEMCFQVPSFCEALLAVREGAYVGLLTSLEILHN